MKYHLAALMLSLLPLSAQAFSEAQRETAIIECSQQGYYAGTAEFEQCRMGVEAAMAQEEYENTLAAQQAYDYEQPAYYYPPVVRAYPQPVYYYERGPRHEHWHHRDERHYEDRGGHCKKTHHGRVICK